MWLGASGSRATSAFALCRLMSEAKRDAALLGIRNDYRTWAVAIVSHPKAFVGRRVMKDYTIYCLAKGARLVAARSVKAPDDEQALAAAGRLQHGTKREVWFGSRLIGRIEVDPLTTDFADHQRR